MKLKYIFPLVAAALLASGCSKEDPFTPGNNGDAGSDSDYSGKVLKSALAVNVDADVLNNTIVRSRADFDINDFTIVFTKEGGNQPAAKYVYSEMPDVVILSAGKYTATATYGENRDAAWSSPYFVGASAEFEVVANEITSYIEPIECKLENIMVSIDFDSELRAAMSPDSYVDVKVGNSATLQYGTAEADAGKAGYFKHQDEISLVAVFHGSIEGAEIVETKSMQNIEKGNHYKITFKLHTGAAGNLTGEVNGEVSVDASATVVDVNRNVSIEDEPLEEEGDRPTNGGGSDPDVPNPPVNPDEPALPTITAFAPTDLDAVNDGNTLESCVLVVRSSADGGFTGLTCDIVSPTLTKEELQSVGLDDHLDLVNTPSALVDPLSGLGFPVNVGGQKEVTFNLTQFLPVLGMLGQGEHHFELKVTDANGTTAKTLKIKF